MADFLDTLLKDKAMVVCCGSGGVGKTTTSAVLALEAACRGRKAVVLTIDPAKRLANSLGLSSLEGNVIHRVDDAVLRAAGLDPRGELHAMMLDCKRTFDALVERYAATPDMAQAILKNRYYQHLSDAMTGSHEYMAMEKLYELHEQGEFDLIVLDTPPTQNALDFLDAPNRMGNFLDESVLKWFMKPYFKAGEFGLKTAQHGAKIIFKVLENLTGVQMLRDLSEFFSVFSGMYAGFKDRAAKVRDLMRDPRTGFVLITSPNPLTLEECVFFYDKLKEYEMPVAGVIVNKVNPELELPGAALPISGAVTADLARRLLENAKAYQALGLRDRQAIESLLKEIKIKPEKLRTVPCFDEDVVALKDLALMQSALFARFGSAAELSLGSRQSVR